MKLNSHQLRASRVGESQEISKRIARHPVVIVLDNVLDTYNIGSFFRLADAIAARKIYLCGSVVTPPNIKIHRASIGTWKFIDWENPPSTADCLRRLKQDGHQIVACEQNSKSINYQKIIYRFPVALVFGSETNGISDDALSLADKIIEIPIYGINKSLNVLVAASVIAYNAISRLKIPKK